MKTSSHICSSHCHRYIFGGLFLCNFVLYMKIAEIIFIKRSTTTIQLILFDYFMYTSFDGVFFESLKLLILHVQESHGRLWTFDRHIANGWAYWCQCVSEYVQATAVTIQPFILVCHQIFTTSNMTGAPKWNRNWSLFRRTHPWFTSVFSCSSFLCTMFSGPLFVLLSHLFWPLYCSSDFRLYSFWLPLWYLQSYLI